jgi:hypothetical protein
MRIDNYILTKDNGMFPTEIRRSFADRCKDGIRLTYCTTVLA